MALSVRLLLLTLSSSAFFARPINIATVYSHTYTEEAEGKRSLSLPADDRIASTSASTPIYQARQVELRCSDKVVCTATSTIILRSPKAARLFLEDPLPHRLGASKRLGDAERKVKMECLEVDLERLYDLRLVCRHG